MTTGLSEADIQNLIRLEAPRRGWHLWRNNVGVLMDRRGVPVRYGLANDSKAMNEVLKSGDLIGWTKTGRFISIECKSPDGPVNPAQVAWQQLVMSSGGIAVIARGIGDLPDV